MIERKKAGSCRYSRRAAILLLCGTFFLGGCTTEGKTSSFQGWEPVPDEEVTDTEAIKDTEKAENTKKELPQDGTTEKMRTEQAAAAIEVPEEAAAESLSEEAAGENIGDNTEVAATSQTENAGEFLAEAETGADAQDEIESGTAMDQLEASLEEKLTGVSGSWAVYVKDVDTGKTISLNSSPMVAASLIKLYIAGAYFESTEAGENYDGMTDVMLTQSDNDAANTLIDLLGYDEINTFIGELPLSDHATVLNRKMLEASEKENYTSVEDCGKVLEMILDGTYVNSAASERILNDLKAQERVSKIPAGVPVGIETANKTGELENTENDAAIVWGPDSTYILVVMANDLDDTAAARTVIVNISAMVYNAIG